MMGRDRDYPEKRLDQQQHQKTDNDRYENN